MPHVPKVILQNDAYYYLPSSNETIADAAKIFSVTDSQRIQDVLDTHAVLEGISSISELSVGQVYDAFTLGTAEVPDGLAERMLKLTERDSKITPTL